MNYRSLLLTTTSLVATLLLVVLLELPAAQGQVDGHPKKTPAVKDIVAKGPVDGHAKKMPAGKEIVAQGQVKGRAKKPPAGKGAAGHGQAKGPGKKQPAGKGGAAHTTKGKKPGKGGADKSPHASGGPCGQVPIYQKQFGKSIGNTKLRASHGGTSKGRNPGDIVPGSRIGLEGDEDGGASRGGRIPKGGGKGKGKHKHKRKRKGQGETKDEDKDKDKDKDDEGEEDEEGEESVGDDDDDDDNDDDDEDGDEEDGGFRILHGLTAVKGEWPWIARLTMCRGDGCSTCTGSLISNRWIVTAGHCGYRSEPKGTTATLGLYNVVKPDDISKRVKVDKIFVHPKYDNAAINNDVALFRLATPVTFGTYLQPICLLDEGVKDVISYSKGKKCLVVGYGLNENKRSATSLQKLNIEPRSPAECTTDRLSPLGLSRGTVCIGPNTDSGTGSTCNGDSGGPNACYDEANNRWQIFAVVSYGIKNCDRATGDKWLTVSSDLTNYRSWITETMDLNQ